MAIAQAVASKQKSQVQYSHIQKAVSHTTAFMDEFNNEDRMRSVYN